MKLEVLDKENKKVSDFEINDDFLAVKVKDDLIHDVMLAYEQNQHTGSSNTLKRGEVRGGGKKPWKQKGTGQARHGSIRSPIWKGGGVTFGPRPDKARININKSMKKLALQAVLAGKLRDGEIVVLDAFTVATPKTKEVVTILKNFNLKNSKVLLVADSVNDTLIKSARNIEKLTVTRQSTVNIYDLLTHKKVLMTKRALEEIISRKG